MLVFPPVKINLGLNIIEKRNDGFHNIASAFFPVPWTDALEALITDKQNFTFSTSGIPIPGNSDNNLVVRAYNLLRNMYSLPGISMHLHKVLPMGAGLGGGSSNGTSALKLINDLCGLELGTQKLHELAAHLGSDCPFFVENKAKFVSGRGDILEPLAVNLQGWYMLIVMPAVSIGTAEAYSWIRPCEPDVSIKDILSRPPEDWKGILKNDFETPAIHRYPVIGEIKDKLYSAGAVYASMSGSGAAVYGLFRAAPGTALWKNEVHWCGEL